MLDTLSLPAVNRLLRSNSWALDKLRPHAGKTIAVACAPITVRYTLRDDGLLERAHAEAPADATIAVTPGMLMRAAARDTGAFAGASGAGGACRETQSLPRRSITSGATSRGITRKT